MIVADYFAMLTKELEGERVNKRAHNRALREILSNRTAGSIEFKHANISAVLIELGFPYIDGYKPRSNYQELLRESVATRLGTDDALRRAVEAAIAKPVQARPESVDWELILEYPPERDGTRSRVYETAQGAGRLVKGVDYLEREARNRSLGMAGEEFVLELEHARLWKAGARRLAERIEHVSRERGDGLGYDILSFETSGAERLIEVKTTRFGPMTPFFASRNEVEVSESTADRYHLYRLFRFGKESDQRRGREKGTGLFLLPGALSESVSLDPVAFRASLR